MDKAFVDRPELVMGPNPFIEALPPYLPPAQIARAFAKYPLADKPWQSLPPSHREALLDFGDDHTAPTSLHLPVAITIQAMIRGSMKQRNPLDQRERQRCCQIGMAERFEVIRGTTRMNASGSTLEGMTGMGKSLTARRALELFAPQQVIEHGASAACGWSRLKQVSWLYVDHPSNGTRGALLKRILEALDRALGTDFSDQYARVTNIDTLLTQVSKQLCLHRVALLIIDEKQQRNFRDSPWSLEFVLFYLSLMNLGISVLLIGNPMAFEFLKAFSQVVRRFSIGGMHRLDPAEQMRDPWWHDDLTPRLHRFNLMDTVAIDPLVRLEFEFEHSAGVPGLLHRLHIEAQRVALRRAHGELAKLELADYLAAIGSPGYKELSHVAEQIRNRRQVKPTLLDIPEDSDLSNLPAFRVPNDATAETLKRMTINLQVKQAKDFRSFRSQLDSLNEMSEDELQALGVTNDLLAGAQAMQIDRRSALKKPKSKS